jgi:hypothetical protein
MSALRHKRPFAVAALSGVSRRRYSAIVVSDDNSTEVCTKPSAWDSRPAPIYSLTVVHVKFSRFQSTDVIRTSENSRNFRPVCTKNLNPDVVMVKSTKYRV